MLHTTPHPPTTTLEQPGQTPNRYLGVEVIGLYACVCIIVLVILFLNIRITEQNFMLADVLVLAGITNFLHGNLYGVIFWISAKNSGDNTGMF